MSSTSAGAPLLTSRRFDRTPSPSAASDVNAGAHARLKDARETERVGQPTPTDVCGACDNMEEKRINASIVGKNKTVEAEAATKIQASFRGYQVRKQLKTKVSHLFCLILKNYGCILATVEDQQKKTSGLKMKMYVCDYFACYLAACQVDRSQRRFLTIKTFFNKIFVNYL